MIMRHNNDQGFVGLQTIKAKQKEQLILFERWASNDQWSSFHSGHYDWWMFPIDEPSSYGYAWTVYKGDIAELKQDREYIRGYLRGAELLALSWGWDLKKRGYVVDPKPDQKWQHWPIRLYKASKSLKLIGFDAYFESMSLLARDLISKFESMAYRERHLGAIFTCGTEKESGLRVNARSRRVVSAVLLPQVTLAWLSTRPT
jgi:hypothetical protein